MPMRPRSSRHPNVPIPDSLQSVILPAVGDGRDFRCGQERMDPSVRQVRRGLGFYRDQARMRS